MATKKIKTEELPTTNTKSVIGKMRITEKTSALADRNAYTFMVSLDTTKSEIKKAIQTLHKVTPMKIGITQIPAKNTFIRGRYGKTKALKKAVVYLKKGDKISVA
jgi:large subunit ribosomal protein L23